MNWFIVSSFFAFLINFFLGLLVFLKDKKNNIYRFFCIMSLSIAGWNLFAILETLSSAKNMAFLWDKLLHSCAILFPIMFAHFIFVVIGNKINRIFLSMIYITAVFLLFLNFISALVPDLIIKDFAGFRYYYSLPSTTYVYFLLFFISVLVISLYELIISFNKAGYHKRSQFVYIIMACVIGLPAPAIHFLVVYTNQAPPFGPLFVVAYGLLMAYAITKEELMDIRVVIGRNATYVLVGILLFLSFISLNGLKMPMLLAMTTNALLALFWAWGAHRLREFIQTPVDKWISWYKPEELLNSIVKEVGLILEREKAFNVISYQLKNKMKVKDINVLLGRKNSNSNFFEYVLLTDKQENQQPLDHGHPFIANLKEAINYNKLPSDIKESIKEFDILRDKFYLPLYSSEGLEGVIILGQKVSEDPYDKKDLIFFETLTIQTKAILDRIRPYEKMRQDFESNQKKLYDTERILARSEKMASLANLIREYNHEIKTPLAIIRGETERLNKEPRDKGYLEWFSNLVIKHIDRADDIVESTLRLSRQKEHTEVDVNINEAIEAALKIYPPSGISLVKEFGDVPIIRGDLSDLQTVFVNLIKNAVESMTSTSSVESPEGGKLKIKTYSVKENDENLVYIEISDTGVGIPKENMEKIYEPFFSTHVTKGRGLGLSIVFRIIREHLGSIEVDSELGKGSIFRIKLRAK